MTTARFIEGAILPSKRQRIQPMEISEETAIGTWQQASIQRSPAFLEKTGLFGSLFATSLTQSRTLALSGPGKSSGTFCVTLPVAAHSTPRWKGTMKATLFSALPGAPNAF